MAHFRPPSQPSEGGRSGFDRRPSLDRRSALQPAGNEVPGSVAKTWCSPGSLTTSSWPARSKWHRLATVKQSADLASKVLNGDAVPIADCQQVATEPPSHAVERPILFRFQMILKTRLDAYAT